MSASTQQCSKRIERFAFQLYKNIYSNGRVGEEVERLDIKKYMMAQQQHRGKDEARRERSKSMVRKHENKHTPVFSSKSIQHTALGRILCETNAMWRRKSRKRNICYVKLGFFFLIQDRYIFLDIHSALLRLTESSSTSLQSIRLYRCAIVVIGRMLFNGEWERNENYIVVSARRTYSMLYRAVFDYTQRRETRGVALSFEYIYLFFPCVFCWNLWISTAHVLCGSRWASTSLRLTEEWKLLSMVESTVDSFSTNFVLFFPSYRKYGSLLSFEYTMSSCRSRQWQSQAREKLWHFRWVLRICCREKFMLKFNFSKKFIMSATAHD